MLAATSACALAQTAVAKPVYVALGDSITFGETNLHYVKSYGDRGYVGDYANYLGHHNGTRPKVVNLAIDGETASSFMTGHGRTPPVKGRGDVPLARENLHYDPGPLVTQAHRFHSAVANQHAAGNPIKNVTMTLGFNGLAALASLPEHKALKQIGPELANYKQHYSSVLSDVRQHLPHANLYLLNYYNPFPADPSSPAAPIFAAGGAQLNAIIKQMAARYGAFYVDTHAPFVGHEGQYTYEGVLPAGATVPGPYGGILPIGDVHPNALGYRVIAQQIIAARRGQAAAVPEPSSWGLLGAGLVLLILGWLWRRRGFGRGDDKARLALKNSYS
jgi:lysophospholipase L1-like esterase